MNTTQQATPGVPPRQGDSFLVQAWLVLFLASLFGAALAGIQLSLAPKIEANKLNETIEKVPELIFGAETAAAMADRKQPMAIERRLIETGSGPQKKVYSVFQAKLNKTNAGWVIKTTGQGYADRLELLIGVDAAAQSITGLFVLGQKETPGLGSKIIDPVWRNQFIGKSTDRNLSAVKTKASAPGEINAITGATISSNSVCAIINQSLGDLRQPLADAAAAGPETGNRQQEKN